MTSRRRTPHRANGQEWAELPDIAVDPNSGSLYAVWHDGRFSGFQHNDIALATSTDLGLTWTTPVRVNLTPPVPEIANRQAFTPSVHVAADGTVGVSYYDFRNNGADPTASESLETDHFLVRCHAPSASAPNRCADPSGWAETRITQRRSIYARPLLLVGCSWVTIRGLPASGTASYQCSRSPIAAWTEPLCILVRFHSGLSVWSDY
jgi:hypothetical protein